MKKIILHIGSGKTGSSSIQQALHECREQNKGIFKYPKLLNFNGNQIFRFAFCPSSGTPSNIRRKYANKKEAYLEYQESIKNSFISEVANENCVVVSSEFLFLSTEEEVRKIKEFFSSLGFDEIHVIMYLRDPAKYYLSAAQQSLKNQPNMPTPDNFRYELTTAIDNWSSIKPTSLTVKEFNRSTLEAGDVVKDIEKYINNIDDSNATLNVSHQQNETMSVEGTIILQEYHQLLSRCNFDFDIYDTYARRARYFSKKAGRGTKPKLKNEISSYIYRKYESELKLLNQKFNIFSELVDNTLLDIDLVGEFVSFLDIVDSFDIDSYLELKSDL
jgi:hypothetical protein